MHTPGVVLPSADWLPSPADEEPVPLVAAPPEPARVGVSGARRFAGALAVFVCGFLFVRTACVEPFGVPTGSMANTLVGNHREAPCPRCDLRVVVGEPGPDARAVRFDACRCPNCNAPIDLSAAREVPGDRLLVDKTAYQSRSPRRWEAAVFRCLVDNDRPYVKRVLGLPGETVTFVDGDAFADGVLLRKTLAQLREVWVPVFELAHAPPTGWGPRWVVQPLGGTGGGTAADAAVLRDGGLCLDGAAGTGVGVTYRQRNLDTAADEPVTDALGYNGPPSARRAFAAPVGEPVHDFAVTFTLDIPAGATGRVACRLFDGADGVRAEFPVGATTAESPGVTVAADKHPLSTRATGLALAAGRSYAVEFALADRRASLAIDGAEVVPAVDLPAAKNPRGGVTKPVQFGASGAAVTLRDVVIRRDVHYPAVGKSAWKLGLDEFFMVGDNAGNSHDSRAWATPDGKPAPGVPAGAFVGKPFLVHQPLRLARLPGGASTPAPDWSRLRFLR